MKPPAQLSKGSASMTRTGEQHQVKFEASQTPTMVGPLPAPELLKQYAELVPDLPERFMTLVEREQAHRHEFDNKLLAEASRQSKDIVTITKRSQWFTFATIVVGVGVSAALALSGHQWVAGALATATFGTGAATLWSMAKRKDDAQTVIPAQDIAR